MVTGQDALARYRPVIVSILVGIESNYPLVLEGRSSEGQESLGGHRRVASRTEEVPMQRSEAQLTQFSRSHVAAAFLIGAASCRTGSNGFCKEVSREIRTLRIPRTLNPSLFDICVNSGDCKYLCQEALPKPVSGTKEDVDSCAPPADGGSAQAADA